MSISDYLITTAQQARVQPTHDNWTLKIRNANLSLLYAQLYKIVKGWIIGFNVFTTPSYLLLCWECDGWLTIFYQSVAEII